MKPSIALQMHRIALRELVAKHGLQQVRFFGSVLRGEDTEDSDLDLLVDPDRTTTLFTLAALQIDAEKLLGVPVDVLTPKSLPRRTREKILREAAFL